MDDLLQSVQNLHHGVDVELIPGTQPIVNASFNNPSVDNNGRLNAIVNIELSRAKDLTAEEYEQLLVPMKTWVCPPDYEADLRRNLKVLSEGSQDSATWIFQHENYLRWQSGESRLLWIAGRPGAGKSVIASSLVQALSQDETNFVGYAFASKTDENRKHTALLIRSVIWQMLSKRNLDLDKKKRMAAVFRRSPTEPISSTSQSPYSFENVFEQYLEISGPTTLIFDGLDECTMPHDFILGILRTLN